jgi:hypothetical protein
LWQFLRRRSVSSLLSDDGTWLNLPPVAYMFSDSHPNGWLDAVLTAESMRLELQAFDPKQPTWSRSRLPVSARTFETV